MPSETTFTTSRGSRCQFEIVIDENGAASANVVWIGQAPTKEDIAEFGRFIEEQAAQSQFEHTGISNYMIGEIQKEDLPRLPEIVAERLKETSQDTEKRKTMLNRRNQSPRAIARG